MTKDIVSTKLRIYERRVELRRISSKFPHPLKRQTNNKSMFLCVAQQDIGDCGARYEEE